MEKIAADNFDDLLNDAQLGNEPSDHYMERVTALDNVVRECIHVSRSYSGIKSPTSQHFYASVLFTSLITRGVSLVTLAPHSPWASKVIEHWDYASVAGIVRSMLEARLAFHYLCVDSCSREEWECRWNIFDLHDCTSRKKLFDTMGSDQTEIEKFEKQREELCDRLRSNTFFMSLPTSQQKNLLNGKTAYLFPLEVIAERVGIGIPTFRMMYALFSSHVHSLPMSFYRIGGDNLERGRGLPSPVEEGYTSLFLSFALTLLVGTRDEVHSIFASCLPPSLEQKDVPVEASISEDLSDPDKFSVGTTVDVLKNDTIRMAVARTDSNILLVTCYHVPTGIEVLRYELIDDEGAILHFFDQTFWTVLVNGKAAINSAVENIQSKRLAFKVDPNTRTIDFKM